MFNLLIEILFRCGWATFVERPVFFLSSSSARCCCCQLFFLISFDFFFLVFSDFLLVKTRASSGVFGGPHMIFLFNNFMLERCSMSGIMLELC